MIEPASLALGAEHTLDVVALDDAGDGIAYPCADRAMCRITVAGAVPGERARVRVEHVSPDKRRAVARLLELATAHPARRPPVCARHFAAGGACGGCPLMMLDAEAQREVKRRSIQERFGLELAGLVGGAPLGYRMSSKRVVGGRPGALVLGSYRRGSHRLADMSGCMVDHPLIVECLDELAACGDACRVTPFDESTGTGDLRYVWLKCDASSVLLTLVTAIDPSPAAATLGARLQRPAGVAWSVQSSSGNAIRGAAPRILRGRARLDVSMAGTKVEIGPLGFLQPNPVVATLAYDALLADADGTACRGELAFDLYAGAGAVTHRLRERFTGVRACDAYPEGAERLGIAAMSAGDFLLRERHTGARPDLVVANPPRAGLGARVCAELLDCGAARLHVMSCNPASLVRDLERLASAYELVAVRGYDTLPQTAHVELVAWLRRRAENGLQSPLTG